MTEPIFCMSPPRQNSSDGLIQEVMPRKQTVSEPVEHGLEPSYGLGAGAGRGGRCLAMPMGSVNLISTKYGIPN